MNLILSEKQLAKGISAAFARMESAKKGYVLSVISLGEKLNEAKQTIAYGQWEAWLKRHSEFRFDDRQARKYMQIYSNKSLVLEFFDNERSVDGITRAIADATPEQIARVEQLKLAEKVALPVVIMEPEVIVGDVVVDIHLHGKERLEDCVEGEFYTPEPSCAAPVETAPELNPDLNDDENYDIVPELHSQIAKLTSENEAMKVIFEDDNHTSAAIKQLKNSKEAYRVLESRFYGLQVENNELKQTVKYWKNEAKKAGAANVK